MKLPRNLDDLVDSGRHNVDSFVGSGRQNLDSLVAGGRRSARRLYRDGGRWIADRLPEPQDVRRSAKRGLVTTRRAADDRLRAPVRWIEDHLLEPRRPSSVLLPSVLAAAGAGVAFWWWTSWSRGRAEAAERAALDAAGGAAGRAHPEQVMAHAAEPAGASVEAPDPSAAKLVEPAEDLMAHSPPPPEIAAPATVGAVAPSQTVKALDEDLAVQGAAPKGRRKAGEASA